jgi:hypothetical protein
LHMSYRINLSGSHHRITIVSRLLFWQRLSAHG